MKSKRGLRTVKITPLVQAVLDAQRDAFVRKFGREPGPEDPIFFDPDADEPRPDRREAFDDALDKIAEQPGMATIVAKFRRQFG